MNPSDIRYAVITPVRDEAQFIEAAIGSMVSQTIRPAEWIIVNDGSTDGTGTILDRYASQHPWIHVVHRTNRGFRHSGAGVVEAFNAGYEQMRRQDWDFIVKLDGDLLLEPTYFQRCFEHFEKDPKLGIGGGTVFHIFEGREVIESNPRFHVRGATKIYRRECWDAIGGLWPNTGWDTVDEVKSQMMGWTSETFAEIKLLQQRPTGTAESQWKDGVKSGLARYVAGYHPVYILVSCMARIPRRPYVTGSLALLTGYLKGYLQRVPRDPSLVRFIRHQQLRRLAGMQTVLRYK